MICLVAILANALIYKGAASSNDVLSAGAEVRAYPPDLCAVKHSPSLRAG